MGVRIKDDNYIVIPARARLDYNLKGNDLLVYGIIHGFTHDNFGWKELSLQYVCDWIGVSDKSRVSIIINRLVESGAIEKEDYYVNNVKFCKYRVKPLPRSGNHNGDVVESTTGGIVENTTHNNIGNSIEDNMSEDNSSRIINNTSNNISSSKEKSKKEIFDLSFVNIEFEDVFNEWLDYKRSKNQMYKRQIDVEIAYRKLLEYSGNDPKIAQEIIESAILGNYMGFFAPKKQSNYGNSSTKTQQPVNRFQELAKHFPNTGGVL